MDEPQHVLISAGNEDTLRDAESRVNEVVGLIIGRKGENLRHLQEMFSVQLRVGFPSRS